MRSDFFPFTSVHIDFVAVLSVLYCDFLPVLSVGSDEVDTVPRFVVPVSLQRQTVQQQPGVEIRRIRQASFLPVLRACNDLVPLNLSSISPTSAIRLS